VDTAFNAGLTSGNVTEAALVSGRLIISGTFPKKILAVNPTTGANTGYINVAVTGSVTTNAGPVEIYRFAVNPAGTKLVGVGNFTTVGGATHYRALVLDLGATAASVSAWNYPPLQQMCASSSLPDYMRDVDFSPDGLVLRLRLHRLRPAGRPDRYGAVRCDGPVRDREPVPDAADLDQLHRRRHAALGRGHRPGRVRAGPPALAEQPAGPGQRRSGRSEPAGYRRDRPDHRAGAVLEPDQGPRRRG
jgi:hypothetical protein